VKPITPSEEFVRRLLEHAHDSIHIIDERGVSVFDSSRLHDGILGYAQGELIGRNNFDLLHDDDRAHTLAALQAIFQNGKAGPVEYRLLHKDGSWRVYETIGQRYLDEDGRIFAILNTRETTEQHRVREEMRQLEAQLRQSQKLEEIGRLAGGIAHDFNNLLAAILGYAERLEDRVAADGDALADVAEIRRAGQRAAQLTRQLLAFSRKQFLSPRLVQLNQEVRDTVRTLQPMIGAGIEIRLSLEDDPTVRVDPGQLQQVLMNLAINARDAMPRGGAIDISTRTAWRDAGAPGSFPPAAGRYARLTIADTGTGIPPEVLPLIFEPFYTTKPEGLGTGLGLAMAYGIVKQSEGDITVESTGGAGARFHVDLPVVE